MIDNSSSISDAPRSPPWAATGSVFVALFALAVSLQVDAPVKHGVASGLALSVLGPLILAVTAILASFLSRHRLVRGRPAVWIVRGVALFAIAMYAMATTERVQAFYYATLVARMFSLGFVLECAVQHWEVPAPGQPRNAMLVFLAAIVFVLAARTNNSSYIKFFTPNIL